MDTHMWIRLISACSLFALAGAAAFGGGSIDGRWVVDPNDTVKSLIFVFKVNNGVLTGTATPGNLGPVELSNGKVDGDHISFEVTREVMGFKVTTKYAGTISGDVINLKGSNLKGSLDLVVRKK